MSTTIIDLNGVELSYPIYSIRANSIRNTIANLAVGGKLLKDGQDIIHVRALENINFSLHQGDRLGIMGHNGAGKTTLLKVLAGVYEPDKGRVFVSGRVSSMIDIGLGLDAALTGRDNILNMGRMRGIPTRKVLASIPEIVDFSELGGYVDLPVKAYSAGMQARLVFAVATSLEPDVLLLDEWIGAGDASFQDRATARMNDILARSRVMVLATHSRGMIESVCNKILILDAGRQVFFGDVGDWNFDTLTPK
ncbi:ABC transporter ATP-binding protein [Asticcacaulis sp. EMRT-3]|uniref:ABC transporter ATP-binding protein n=1 Tax=Asticcacaulis sp. EMRT-3 TaxID=3040349 RepID=UPI0024AF8EDF|nr:ABC transporter ATP-binding protein [Asticcacaulis sp. EMRT-3]MDI7776357.1 ABC transporter ATP-binding protein [Asticcacaulis sp. EMRT-3]